MNDQDRRPRTVVVAEKRGRFMVGVPLFEPGPQLPLGKTRDLKPGRMALLDTRGKRPRLLRALGSPDRARDVVDALVAERLDRAGFSAKLKEAARVAADSSPGGRRRDLTGLTTFTVDPATARDFDDAVSAKEEGDGVRLWIHIADVAAYVKPGSPLDREAYARATSTYVPGFVEPMLPPALSDDVCSLVPGEERLAVTTEILLGADGTPKSTSFYRSRVRSEARLNYDQLDQIFAGRERAPEPVAGPLALTRRVAATLADRRRGTALTVESSEPEFKFKGRDVVGARNVAQTEAHRLIEQLMVLTNERVAGMLEQRKVPTLYRVHEAPDPDGIEHLVEKLAALDVPTPPLPKRPNARQAGELAATASRLANEEAKRRGHGVEAYTSLVLRSLKQALYSEKNLGHAGLGSAAYTHFTSPIRRYPDLIVHRALLAVNGEGEEAPKAGDVRKAAPHVSERERDAMRLERDADDVCAAFLLAREVAERGRDTKFEGEVVGLVGAGAFVSFEGKRDTAYEGFLPARRLRGERFELDETETRLVGSKTGRTVRLGDPVSVSVGKVDAPRGRVDLDPTDG